MTKQPLSNSPLARGEGNPKIEYENEDLLIIDKPAGLPVYSAPSHEDEDSVLKWALGYCPEIKSVGDPQRPGIVHRLDKQTSGLLVLAKNQKTFEYLKDLFKTRNINKEYTTLVYGQMPKHGVIDKPLTKIGHEGQSRVRVDESGKASVTEYWTLQYCSRPLSQPLSSPGERGLSFSAPPLTRGGIKGEVEPLDRFTLLRVKLHTGRTHQIRVHLASEKHPVMGDSLYGKPVSQKLSDILPRQFLHASRLELQLPDETWLEVESKLPKDLEQTLSQLQQN